MLKMLEFQSTKHDLRQEKRQAPILRAIGVSAAACLLIVMIRDFRHLGMCSQPKIRLLSAFCSQGMISTMSKMAVKLKRLKNAAHERLKNIEHCDPAVQAELEARKDDSESPASHDGHSIYCPSCCFCFCMLSLTTGLT